MTQTPSIQDLKKARQVFETNEPRDLFYRAATELVALSLEGTISLSVAESLAVLLQTWNKMFYQYQKFNSQHFADIERLISDYHSALMEYRQRSIVSFNQADEDQITPLFRDFETDLGPVGAAKCLHLLAPSFFPLWDRAIADAYGCQLQRKGRNAERYCRFMRIVKEQVEHLGGQDVIGPNPLKALDEYNYCKFTKRWS
jgi:hypothetical protein